jgi:hypothetical protein
MGEIFTVNEGKSVLREDIELAITRAYVGSAFSSRSFLDVSTISLDEFKFDVVFTGIGVLSVDVIDDESGVIVLQSIIEVDDEGTMWFDAFYDDTDFIFNYPKRGYTSMSYDWKE